MLDAVRGFGVEGRSIRNDLGNNRYCRLHRAHPSKIAKGGAPISSFNHMLTRGRHARRTRESGWPILDAFFAAREGHPPLKVAQ